MKHIFFLSLALLPAPLQAQQSVQFDIIHTQSCLEEAIGNEEMRACIGASASACMGANNAGMAPAGSQQCMVLETAWWDKRLNAVYGERVAEDRFFDTSDDENLTYPPRLDALRTMQRAWIAFRDATCEYEFAVSELWVGNGPGGGMDYTYCVMRMTGEQALYLASYPEFL